MIRPLAAFALLSLLATGTSAQSLMVPESSNDTVMLFDPFDGSLVNPTFIDMTGTGVSTPIEALVVNGEIWVSDQLLDGFLRFSLDGTAHLGNVTGAIDNCRGFEVVGDRVFLSNSGTGNGAPGDAMLEFDTSGTPVTNWPAGDPFDALLFGGDLLIANILTDDLDVHALDGTFLMTFHNSDGITGIDFPEQVNHGAGGNVLAAGFSDPDGVYEYDSTGTQLNFWDTFALGGEGGLRGVWLLGNGNILFTNGNGVHVLDPTGPSISSVVTGVSARFISLLEGGAGPINAACFGDGSAAPCGCNNESPPGSGGGCLHGAGGGTFFATLSASGSPDTTSDTLQLTSTDATDQPGLYFQGDNSIGMGTGVTFGDGIRCCGMNVVRLEIVDAPPSPNGVATTSTSVVISQAGPAGTVNSGDTKCYQHWYRNPGSSPCGNNFNLSNSVIVTWS